MTSIITRISGGYESLNDDTLGLILEFVGKKSYCAYGATNKRCNQIYLSKNLPKKTFLYGYAPLAIVKKICARLVVRRNTLSLGSPGYGVLFYNRRDILEWAFLKQQERPDILYQIFNTALEAGRFDILNEIHDRSTKDVLDLDNYKLHLVARNGKLDTLKWLDTRSYLDHYKKRRCAHSAAEGGHLNILLWLRRKIPFDDFLKNICADSAAEGGHLHVLEWLIENGCFFYEEMKRKYASSAARGGKLNILEWLCDNGCSFDSRSIAEAARGGHLYVLQWLIDNGCSVNESTFRIAAERGHLHVLEWLRDINCPWDQCCYKAAAIHGHVHVLDWLRDNEYQRDDAEIGYHEKELRDDVVIWLCNNGFSMLQDNDIDDEYLAMLL